MRRYLIRRLLQGIPVLFVVSLLVFLVLNLLPGDPVMARQGAFMDANYAELMATLKHQMGLDRPIPERYAIWVWHALQGDFGVSYITQNSVAGLIGQKLPATLELTVLSLVVAMLVALPAGILAALQRQRLHVRSQEGEGPLRRGRRRARLHDHLPVPDDRKPGVGNDRRNLPADRPERRDQEV